MEVLKVLVVEDHPIICESYKKAFDHIKAEARFQFTECHNIDEVCKHLNSLFDYILLDINLGVSESSPFKDGEELGSTLRAKLPNAKIIILTSITDSYKIYKILKNVSPQGFLIKGESSFSDLVDSIKKSSNNHSFYSDSVSKVLTQAINEKDSIDDLDREILHYLTQGVMTKDLPNHIPLSISAIEKRKRKLSSIFELDKVSNFHLLNEGKKRGLI